VIATFLRAGRTKVLSVTGALVALIAMADWFVGNKASLGVFYILPMMLGAIVLVPMEIVALALVCSFLKSWFDIPSPRVEVLLRFVFAFLAYAGSGFFVIALMRNRREQDLRREAEEQLKVLVESSPAAILTVDGQGIVLAANHAADNMFSIDEGQTLRGHAIGGYLPVLADALQLGSGAAGLRTAAQCQARRKNGEIFLAHTWFSSYMEAGGIRLAAIVVDSSEEMRDREEQGLRQLIRGNRIAAAAVSHEVRNLCSAIALMCSGLSEKHGIAQDANFQGLTTLVKGLERIASVELHARVHLALEKVGLQQVLNDLRIVIEPDWREIDGIVNWVLPAQVPMVLAERHGLLQAFLNLAQNSFRAVQGCSVRELSIIVSVERERAAIRFLDTGPGIPAPERLFEPFQPGADGAGLGLYVSRAMLRSYGGELRYEPQESGSCFVVEAQVF